MSSTINDKEFTHYVVDLMQGLGPVIPKRMFGGYGIFIEGVMFGLISNGLLYFKADKENKNAFISNNLKAFTYHKKNKECRLSYFQSPEEALENADVMREWASSAYAAALRATASKHK